MPSNILICIIHIERERERRYKTIFIWFINKFLYALIFERTLNKWWMHRTVNKSVSRTALSTPTPSKFKSRSRRKRTSVQKLFVRHLQRKYVIYVFVWAQKVYCDTHFDLKIEQHLFRFPCILFFVVICHLFVLVITEMSYHITRMSFKL